MNAHQLIQVFFAVLGLSFALVGLGVAAVGFTEPGLALFVTGFMGIMASLVFHYQDQNM